MALSLAIAGCGRISERGYLPALRHVPEWDLVAVADPDAERRACLASGSSQPRQYGSVAEMVASERLDGVVVASPPECHVEHAEAAARAGALVLVEKPPGRGPEDARRLAELDRVRIGFNRRFSHLRALEGRVPSGPLDLSLRISYRRSSWRPHQVRDDALSDLGPHLADLAGCLLGGSIERVRADSVAERGARVVLDGPGGRAALRCDTDAPWVERIEVRDSRGRIAARSVHGGLVRGATARLRRGEHPLVESLAAQLRALARVAHGEDAPTLARPGDGERAMLALEAARRSAAAGGEWVTT
jgi:predicted dehydrogenase